MNENMDREKEENMSFYNVAGDYGSYFTGDYGSYPIYGWLKLRIESKKPQLLLYIIYIMAYKKSFKMIIFSSKMVVKLALVNLVNIFPARRLE